MEKKIAFIPPSRMRGISTCRPDCACQDRTFSRKGGVAWCRRGCPARSRRNAACEHDRRFHRHACCAPLKPTHTRIPLRTARQKSDAFHLQDLRCAREFTLPANRKALVSTPDD